MRRGRDTKAVQHRPVRNSQWVQRRDVVAGRWWAVPGQGRAARGVVVQQDGAGTADAGVSVAEQSGDQSGAHWHS